MKAQGMDRGAFPSINRGYDSVFRPRRLSLGFGQYFDNDSGRFAAPHPDALDPRRTDEVIHALEALLARG